MNNLSKYLTSHWEQLKKLGKKEKIIITCILAVSFFIGVFGPQVFRYLLTPPTVVRNIPTTPTPIPIPATIELSSDKKEITLGATFAANIRVESPNQAVEASEFLVKFDPDYVDIATISAGKYFGLYPMLKKIGTDSAKIFGMANLVNNKFIIPKGKGIVATLVFETLNATDSTRIYFDRANTVVASQGKNILGKINDLDITIK